jgi:hypothetical protein
MHKLLEKEADSNIKSVAQNAEMGDTLPTSERQIRPLLTLENDSERVHVWKIAKQNFTQKQDKTLHFSG